MQGEQLSPLHDLNRHLQATGVSYYVEGAEVNSLSFVDVTCTYNVTAFRHSWWYVAHMVDLMRLYTIQRKQCACWFAQSNHRVGAQHESGSQIKNLAT